MTRIATEFPAPATESTFEPAPPEANLLAALVNAFFYEGYAIASRVESLANLQSGGGGPVMVRARVLRLPFKVDAVLI